MKTVKTHREPVLRLAALGFSLIIFLTWLTEFIHLPHLLYNEPDVFLWSRVLVRTGVMLVIWTWVHFSAKRLLNRLHHLEEFLLVCSWCRKVGHQGEWLTMEEYFGSKFSTETSHGICPECARQQLAQHRIAVRVPPAEG